MRVCAREGLIEEGGAFEGRGGRGGRRFYTQTMEISMDNEDAPIPVFSIVPAQPGWYAAVFLLGGSGRRARTGRRGLSWNRSSPGRSRMIILLAGFGGVRRIAVTTSMPSLLSTVQMDSCGNEWAVKRPDGKYSSPEADRTFDDEAEALDYLQKLHDEREVA